MVCFVFSCFLLNILIPGARQSTALFPDLKPGPGCPGGGDGGGGDDDDNDDDDVDDGDDCGGSCVDAVNSGARCPTPRPALTDSWSPTAQGLMPMMRVMMTMVAMMNISWPFPLKYIEKKSRSHLFCKNSPPIGDLFFDCFGFP